MVIALCKYIPLSYAGTNPSLFVENYAADLYYIESVKRQGLDDRIRKDLKVGGGL